MYSLPSIHCGFAIPRVIHQTFPTKDLPPEIISNIEKIKLLNQNWDHILYDDVDIEQFIGAQYGSQLLDIYHRINPLYGAARADLFRYLLMFIRGGVYLDIKSTTSRPLDDCLNETDQYVLSNWKARQDEKRRGWGIVPELAHLPRGEFQQWHIICVPGHPFLKAVIERVVANIGSYRPWREGLGKFAVLRVTGPIPYTLAIQPLLASQPHRLAADEDLGLQYSIMEDSAHSRLFASHYATLWQPVIKMTGWRAPLAAGFVFAMRLRQRLAVRYVRLRTALTLGLGKRQRAD